MKAFGNVGGRCMIRKQGFILGLLVGLSLLWLGLHIFDIL